MQVHRPGVGFAIALGTITLIAPLSIHLFLPAMPEVKSAFGASDAMVQLAFGITLFAMAVATPAYGSISDRYGRRPVLLTGLSFFLLGSLVSAVAPTLPLLIVGRFIQAIGAGCGITLTRAIARDAYGPGALVKAIAYLTMAYTLGPMIAPPLGGLLIDTFGWRSAPWFAFVAGFAVIAAAFFVLYETHRPDETGVRTGGTFGSYGSLLRNRRFVAFVLQSGFMSFGFFAIAAASPFLMKDMLGRSATEYGLYFTLFPLGYCAGNLVSSRLSGRAKIEQMVLAGSLLCFACIAVQSGFIVAGFLSPALLFVPGGLMSFAQGLSLPNAQAGAIRVNPSLAGTAAGLGVFVQFMLSAVATEIYGLLADGTPMPMVLLAFTGAALAVVTAGSLFVGRRAQPRT